MVFHRALCFTKIFRRNSHRNKNLQYLILLKMLGIKKSSGEIKNEIAIKYSVKYYDNLATDGN